MYQVMNGATLGVPPIQTVYGRVLLADGETPAAGALVYVTVRNGAPGTAESAPLSAIIDDQGYWSLNLGAARTPTGDSYYTAERDSSVVVDVQHPDTRGQTQILPTSDLSAGLSLILFREER